MSRVVEDAEDSPLKVADADNFMDFSDTTPATAAPVACISRPHLSADRQTVYEDTSRSGHVLAEMHRLYLTGRLCDVVLCVDSERIPCHRLVMAASSVYFERMFSNDMTESRSPEVLRCADNIAVLLYNIVASVLHVQIVNDNYL